MGKIVLERMEFFAHIGYYQEEKSKGNRFLVDLELETDLTKGGESDLLGNTLDYEEVYGIVKEEMARKANLIEHVGTNILGKLKQRFPDLGRARVRVYKTNPPIRGKVERVFVELEL